MHLSVDLSSLPGQFEEAVRRVADLGFSHVDVNALAHRPASHRDALADTGLLVSCARIGRDLREGQNLDADSADVRRLVVAELRRQIADAALLGATHARMACGLDTSVNGLCRFAEACEMLADFAGQRRVRLCLDRPQGNAGAVLRRLEALHHDNLYLSIDLGQCLVSGENAVELLRRAGPRLGHVVHQLGVNVAGLNVTWELLRDVGYHGAVALAWAGQEPEPFEALRKSRGEWPEPEA